MTEHTPKQRAAEYARDAFIGDPRISDEAVGALARGYYDGYTAASTAHALMMGALLRAADMFEQVACMMDDTGATGGTVMRVAADDAREAIRAAEGEGE